MPSLADATAADDAGGAAWATADDGAVPQQISRPSRDAVNRRAVMVMA
jgi:hypothetical protein